METSYDRLVRRYRDISTLGSIGAVLDWDQQTFMPPKAAQARGDQLALVSGMVHERLVGAETADLLEEATRENPSGEGERANIREIRRRVERARRLPRELVEDLARTQTMAQASWVEAKKASDFDRFAPWLDKLVDLKRQVIRCYDPKGDPYDALLEDFEPDGNTAHIARVLEDLAKDLVPLVAAIARSSRKPAPILRAEGGGSYPEATQRAVALEVLKDIGFDLDAGRLDTSAHPFCSGFAPTDVRLTTRFNTADPCDSVFTVLHEGGHGLYEQGVEHAHAGTPLGTPVSMGVHESQSRIWENQVGRSRSFWRAYLPVLKKAYPGTFDGVGVDAFYASVNRSVPSLIRVTSDEVTYNLHIILRFEIERELLAGTLDVGDLPARWNRGMGSLLGVVPAKDGEGCLQDVHWSAGLFGYFPTYTLGNLYAAQLFEQARKEMPDLDDRVARRDLSPLRTWLREKIHRHGSLWSGDELIRRATGSGLDAAPFVRYLKTKYGEVYGL